jgi:hypothetical protein
MVSRTMHCCPGRISAADLVGCLQHCARFGLGQSGEMVVGALRLLMHDTAAEDVVSLANSFREKTCSSSCWVR